MPTKKRVASNHLRYILIAVGVLLLFTLVRQIDSVLLALSLAGTLYCAMNPLIRRLRPLGPPRAVAAAPGTFVGLTALLAAPSPILRQPEGNVFVRHISGGITGVHPLALFLAVPVVVITPSPWRYPGKTLAFERRGKAPFRELPACAGEAVPGRVREAVLAGKMRAARSKIGNA